MKLTVLGSGTSHGIPVVGCGCAVCRSADSRDKRSRASCYIEGEGGESIVIDTGPEFRLQAIAAGISAINAIFLTHAHADHVHGLDDVRPLSHRASIPAYGNTRTIEEMCERFSYIFKETQHGGGKPNIELFAMASQITIGNLTIRPVPVKHGDLEILGFDIEESREESAGRIAYITDASYIPEDSFRMIGQPDLLIIGCLRKRKHPTHFNIDQALEAAIRVNTGQTLLTHLCHDHFHEEINAYCGEFLEKKGSHIKAAPAFDGQTAAV